MQDVTNKFIGIGWMLFHCLLISIIILIVKFLGLRGYHSMQIVFFHSIVAFIILLPYAILKEGKNIFKIAKPHLYILKGSLWLLSLFLYFLGVKFVPLTDGRAIALFYPVVTFIFAVIFLKEKLDKMKLTALIASIIGGYIIINPGSVSFYKESLFILLAVIIWSIIDLIIKKMSNEPTLKQLFFLTGFLSLFSLPFAIYYWQKPSNVIEILLFIIIGIMFLLNVISMILAIKHADLTIIMPFDFAGMVFTVILSFIMFSEVIKTNTLIGSLIVFTSSVYLIYYQSKKVKKLTVQSYDYK